MVDLLDVGASYRSVRLRLADLLTASTAADQTAWDAAVAACPGWRVRDVLAHLVGNLEDGAAGRITGPPGPVQTQEQVDRHRDDAPRDLLARWTVMAEAAEPGFSRGGSWPVFLDAVSHEHDVRTALGRRDQRDHADVRLAARVLASPWGSAAGGQDPDGRGPGLALVLDDDPPRVLLDGEPRVELRTDSFTWLRARMGRHTRSELIALPWSDDPGPLVDRLVVFGPAEVSLGE